MKLRIIIPVYNSQPYLRRCLDSVINQTFREWELFIVDDGSTDESPAICDEYSGRDERINVIHQQNKGHTGARLRGLEGCNSDYVIFIDSDDWIENDMLEHLYNAAVGSDADIVQCGFFSGKPDRILHSSTPYKDGVYDKKRLENEVYPTMICSRTSPYAFGIAPNMWNKLFRRQLAERFLPGIDTKITSGEDGLMTYQSMLASDIFVNIGDHYYHYCSNAGSMKRHLDIERLRQNHLLLSVYYHLWKDNKILMDQIYKYSTYQTLQVVSVESGEKSLRSVKSECRSIWNKDSVEMTGIHNTKLSEISGKRNRLLLLWMKAW